MTSGERLDANLLLYLDEQHGHLRPDPRKTYESPENATLQAIDRLQLLTTLSVAPRMLTLASVPHVGTERPTTTEAVSEIRSIGSQVRHLRKRPRDLRRASELPVEVFVDPNERNPIKHPGFQYLDVWPRLFYKTVGQIRVFSFWARRKAAGKGLYAFFPFVIGVVAIWFFLGRGTSSEEGLGADLRQEPSPNPVWVDSLREATRLPELQSRKKALVHFPVRPPVPDSIRKLTSDFGRRQDPIQGGAEYHGGVDFSAPRGTPVFAPGRGVVIEVSRSQRSGKYVLIRHAPLPYVSSFAHLKQSFVEKGDSVEVDDIVASVGASGRVTGPHLHFRVKREGRSVDPARLYERYQALKKRFEARREQVQRAVVRAYKTVQANSNGREFVKKEAGVLQVRDEVKSASSLPNPKPVKAKAMRLLKERLSAKKEKAREKNSQARSSQAESSQAESSRANRPE